MKWRLTSHGEVHYFQFTWHRDSAIYSLKKGQDTMIQNLDPVFLKQIHSNVIVDIDSKQERTGDGLLSAGKHNIGVKIADCLPVYLFTPEKICLIHCGWRGIIEGIAKQAREMLKEFQYVLGASIGPCCYEVQHDVADRFIQSHPNALQQRESRYYLDLKTAVIDDLGRRALLGSLNYCTRCHPEYFYSHRRGDSGRNYAIATRRLTD